MDFDSKRIGSGTMEWAEVTENICLGCANDCLYCYAAHNADRFGTKKREDWHNEEFTKRSKMTSYPPKDGVVMFPSSHDITPFNLDEYNRVAELILRAGNKLLIVTKPRIECVCSIVNYLNAYKDSILFRFTIGTINAGVSKLWEPNAPLPNERIMALKYAKSEGFRTSVSIEPMLEGAIGTMHVVNSVHEHVTDTIWIGKMNKIDLRVNLHDDRICVEAVDEIKELQSDEEILALYRALKSDPKIRWKDSINMVLSNYKG